MVMIVVMIVEDVACVSFQELLLYTSFIERY
jgi:hypothetical protein